MMYASLGLPVMVKEATKDLPQHLIKDCFSHIFDTFFLFLTATHTKVRTHSRIRERINTKEKKWERRKQGQFIIEIESKDKLE